MFEKHPHDKYNVYYKLPDDRLISYRVYKQSTMTTKFELIFEQVNIMLSKSEELKTLYDNFVVEFNENCTISTAQKYIPKIFELVDSVGEELNYHNFCYTPPTYKNDLRLHINEKEYYHIMVASLRSKFVCAQVTSLRDSNVDPIFMNIVKYIYGEVLKDLYVNGILFKIEKVVDSTVFYTSSGGLDHKSQLWVLFSSGKGINPQNIALKERNNVLYKALPTVAPGKDPIKWIISIVRTGIRFLMKYKVTQVNIAVNNPVETTDSSNNKLLQMFIYESIISNRQLYKLIGDMPFASSLMSEYVLPITQTITSPFVSMVFDMPNLNINRLPNLVLLNLFTYKFMENAETDWQIFKLLLCKAVAKSKEVEDNPSTDIHFEFAKKSLANLIKKQIKSLGFDKQSIYTMKQLETVFKDSIRQIYRYDYINCENEKVVIHPEIIATEYITYIFRLNIGMYQNQIDRAKQYIMVEYSDNTKDFVNEEEGDFDEDCNNCGYTLGSILENESCESTQDN